MEVNSSETESCTITEYYFTNKHSAKEFIDSKYSTSIAQDTFEYVAPLAIPYLGPAISLCLFGKNEGNKMINRELVDSLNNINSDYILIVRFQITSEVNIENIYNLYEWKRKK